MHGRLLTVLAVAVLAAFVPVNATAAETAWTPVTPTPPLPENLTGGRLDGVAAVSSTDVWAVGSAWAGWDGGPVITHWTGADWHTVDAPSVPDVDYALSAVDAVSARDVWAVGNGSSLSGDQVPVIAHYDGTTWSAVPAPTSPPSSTYGLTDIDMLSATDGWAVGSRDGTSGPQPFVMRWRNGRWASVSVPPVGNGIPELEDVDARASNDVWAVGSLRDPAVGLPAPGDPALVMHFDGTRWSRIAVAHGDVADAGNELSAVTAVSADEVWAVGRSCVQGYSAVCRTLILRMSGGVWQAVPPSGDHGTNLRDVVALSGNDIWAIGYDLSPDGVQETNHVEHWDGQRFTTVPTDAGPFTVRSGLASALEAATRLPGTAELWSVGWQANEPQVIRHS